MNPKNFHDSNYCSLLFDISTSLNLPVEVTIKVSVIGTSGSKQEAKSCCSKMTAKKWSIDWRCFLHRGNLFSPISGLNPNDTLTLSGEIKFTHQLLQQSILLPQLPQFVMENSPFQESHKVQQILQNRFFADLTLIAQKPDQQIKVHKVLLAEASPVLYAKMLLDQNHNVMELDLPYEVLLEVVNFLYNGIIEKEYMINSNVKHLLKAADEVSFVFYWLYEP